MSDPKIIAARLLPYDKKRGFTMRTYTAVSGRKYTAGNALAPSPWVTQVSPDEVDELLVFPQFEVRTFDGTEELLALVEGEMQDRARAGHAPIRAAVENLQQGGRPEVGTTGRQLGKIVKGAADLAPATPSVQEAFDRGASQPQPAAAVEDAFHQADGEQEPPPAREVHSAEMLDDMTKPEILELCDRHGLEVHKRMTRSMLIEALTQAGHVG